MHGQLDLCRRRHGQDNGIDLGQHLGKVGECSGARLASRPLRGFRTPAPESDESGVRVRVENRCMSVGGPETGTDDSDIKHAVPL